MRSLKLSHLLFPLVIAAALAIAERGFAQTFTLSAPSHGQTAGELELLISETPKQGNPMTPPEGDVSDPQLWLVNVFRKTGSHLTPASPVHVTSVTFPADYGSFGRLVLATTADYPLDPDRDHDLVIEIQFLGGSLPTPVFMKAGGGEGAGKGGGGQAQPSSGSASTKGCGGAKITNQPGTNYFNYCFSGSWIPQVGSHPLYTTDSNFALAAKAVGGSLGIRASESADNSVVLDPNAFASAIFYQNILTTNEFLPHVMGAFLNWNLATAEFDRKKKGTNLGTNVNLITAPELVFPVSGGRGLGFEFDTGIETGHNFRNNIDPNGFGAVFRGLLGAQAAKIFPLDPSAKFVKKVKLTSQYQLRLPAYDEVITRSVHGKLVPSRGHQARNWVTTEIDLMFTDQFALTLKYDYGALPPGFVLINSRATVGFTFQSAQK